VYDDVQRVAVNHQCDHFGVGVITAVLPTRQCLVWW